MINLQYKIDKFCKNGNFEFSENKNVILALVDYHRALDLFEFTEFSYKIQKTEILIRLSISYDILSQLNKSIEYLNKAVELVPNIPFLILYRSIILHSLGNYVDSQKSLIKYKQISEKEYFYLYELFKLVFLYTLNLECNVMLREIDEYLDKYPRTGLVLFLKAMIYHKISFDSNASIRNETNQEYSPRNDILLEDINEAGMLYSKYIKEAYEVEPNDTEFLVREGVSQENITKVFFMMIPEMDYFQPKSLVEYSSFNQGFKTVFTVLKACFCFRFHQIKNRIVKKLLDFVKSGFKENENKRTISFLVKSNFIRKVDKQSQSQSQSQLSEVTLKCTFDGKEMKKTIKSVADLIVSLADCLFIKNLPGNIYRNKSFVEDYLTEVVVNKEFLKESLNGKRIINESQSYKHIEEDIVPNIDTNYFIRKNYYNKANYKKTLSTRFVVGSSSKKSSFFIENRSENRSFYDESMVLFRKTNEDDEKKGFLYSNNKDDKQIEYEKEGNCIMEYDVLDFKTQEDEERVEVVVEKKKDEMKNEEKKKNRSEVIDHKEKEKGNERKKKTIENVKFKSIMKSQTMSKSKSNPKSNKNEKKDEIPMKNQQKQQIIKDNDRLDRLKDSLIRQNNKKIYIKTKTSQANQANPFFSQRTMKYSDFSFNSSATIVMKNHNKDSKDMKKQKENYKTQRSNNYNNTYNDYKYHKEKEGIFYKPKETSQFRIFNKNIKEGNVKISQIQRTKLSKRLFSNNEAYSESVPYEEYVNEKGLMISKGLRERMKSIKFTNSMNNILINSRRYDYKRKGKG